MFSIRTYYRNYHNGSYWITDLSTLLYCKFIQILDKIRYIRYNYIINYIGDVDNGF